MSTFLLLKILNTNTYNNICVFSCEIENCDGNNRSNEFKPNWLSAAIPFEKDEPVKCLKYEQLYQLSEIVNSTIDECSILDNFNRTRVVKCDSFIYRTNEVTILNEVS